MNRINARLMTCEHCRKERELAVTQHENGDEFAICYRCGSVTAKHHFDAREYILDLMRDGIKHESLIVDQLTDRLTEEYSWMEHEDLEPMAKLMVHELSPELQFECIAEAQDEAEAMREFSEARAGRY